MNNAGLAFDRTYTRHYPLMHDLYTSLGGDTAAVVAMMKQLMENWPTSASNVSDLIKTGRFDDEIARLSEQGLTDEQIAWSPDGGRIAFLSGRGGSKQVWILRPDGGDLCGAARQQVRGELEPPLREVLHRRNANEVRKSFSEHRPRRAGLMSQGG